MAVAAAVVVGPVRREGPHDRDVHGVDDRERLRQLCQHGPVGVHGRAAGYAGGEQRGHVAHRRCGVGGHEPGRGSPAAQQAEHGGLVRGGVPRVGAQPVGPVETAQGEAVQYAGRAEHVDRVQGGRVDTHQPHGRDQGARAGDLAYPPKRCAGRWGCAVLRRRSSTHRVPERYRRARVARPGLGVRAVRCRSVLVRSVLVRLTGVAAADWQQVGDPVEGRVPRDGESRAGGPGVGVETP